MANLNCPHCKCAFEVTAVFTNCKVCLPDTKSFSFFCPHCNEQSEVRVENATVLIGISDGFPEPSFVKENSAAASGIFVSWQDYGAIVKYGDREWTFGVADYYRKIHSPEYRAEFISKSKEAHERRHRGDTGT